MQEENYAQKINAVQSILLSLWVFTKPILSFCHCKGNVDFIRQIGSLGNFTYGSTYKQIMQDKNTRTLTA